jgi:hypothetical protein
LLARPAPVVVVDLLVADFVSKSGTESKELFCLVKLREFLGESFSFFRSGLIELDILILLVIASGEAVLIPSMLDLPITKGYYFISSSLLVRSKGEELSYKVLF